MNHLKKYREKLGLTQNDVAKQLEMSVRGYQNYELGYRTPDVYQAKKIAQILKTDINKLFP
ncbi:helix-turn-helix transcriptional regulator [Lactococcus taiwanensis]|uniref:helix-turn-helix transcriptional regulator n=1 Tax=Lactococcus taiwanensis TaxID=1151742 RepID=UPI003517AF26